MVMVSAAPNDSRVKAIVQKVGAGSLDMLILESGSVGRMPNFTLERINETITAYTKENLAALKPGDHIMANVRFAGDERGGRFLASGISSLK